MKNFHKLIHFAAIVILFFNCSGSTTQTGIKEGDDTLASTIEDREAIIKEIEPQETAKYKSVIEIPVPEGYTRAECDSGSFGFYLRHLPLKTENNTVYLFDGYEKGSQDVHFAVIKMDVGTKDLQQCADAVMRLWGEYLYSEKKYSEIHFNFLSDGKPRYYTQYAGTDRSYKKFRKYMDYIFSYANTSSLHDELKAVKLEDIQPGDVFIQKGNPYGHAVTVMDVAINNETGAKIFMLSQSYMPAQEIHILRNPNNEELSPWYRTGFTGSFFTPEWIFSDEDLMRF